MSADSPFIVPDWKVVETMERFGGSFVHALAKACQAADPVNLAKIKATWPDYWQQYSDLAGVAKRDVESER